MKMIVSVLLLFIMVIPAMASANQNSLLKKNPDLLPILNGLIASPKNMKDLEGFLKFAKKITGVHKTTAMFHGVKLYSYTITGIKYDQYGTDACSTGTLTVSKNYIGSDEAYDYFGIQTSFAGHDYCIEHPPK